ncbi:MAG: 7-carboxy-7-deazaguanine synthase QueE [Ectothiorhodospira sp.]
MTPPPSTPTEPRLRVSEIFTSLQGEAREMGRPTVFVRLTGCPLRCRYCDTTHAFSGGAVRSLEAVLEQVAGAGIGPVCVTGGEPLAQPACLPLLCALCDAGHEVSLETGGALDVSGVDPRVVKVLDLKTPGSGESHRNLWANLDHLGPRDQVKFVLTDRADYDWARSVMARHGLPDRVEVLLSPVADHLPPARLADWIVADRLPVRFQLQLHKLLWGDVPGR